MKIHKLTLTALLVAIGTLSAHLIYIPAGISKCFPVQHAINVLGAVILGPGDSMGIRSARKTRGTAMPRGQLSGMKVPAR